MKIKILSPFKKDYKKYIHNSKISILLCNIITKLCNNEILDLKYNRHNLKGNYKGFESLHIQPDLILIFKISDDIINLYRIGTHCELYQK